MAEDDAQDDDRKRKRPRIGIILRLCIYIPLLGFFGWQALDRFQRARDEADSAFRRQLDRRMLDGGDVITLPNGQQMQVITPERARELGVDVDAHPDSN